MENLGAVAAEAVRHSTRLPIAINTENGIRNFKEAATQTQWRTLAGCFRNTSVSKPATPANRVDCHR
jgi:hypothetical protein